MSSDDTIGTPSVPWYRRTWVIVVASLLVGLAIGAGASEMDPTASPEYKAQVKKAAEARADLEDTTEDLAAATAELVEVEGTIPAREQAVERKESELADREKAVTVSEKKVRKREKAVGIIEAEIAANTVSGEGIYEVGRDMKAGTYKTSGAPGCYFAVLNDPNGDDIANNNNIDGPGIASVRDGQYFETTRCADWVLQR